MISMAIKFLQGEPREWVASVLEDWADTVEEEAADKESGGYVRELCEKLRSPQWKKKMNNGDWESVMLYLHQELSD